MLLTKCFLSGLIFMFSTSIFAVDYELPINQWRMISLPAEPPSGEDTVEKVFGDDLAVDLYGLDSGWVVYEYKTDTIPNLI
jgi:hypothetical protein